MILDRLNYKIDLNFFKNDFLDVKILYNTRLKIGLIICLENNYRDKFYENVNIGWIWNKT